ncbi:helix-turn-helix domain-containing protein [Escherichia coli]|uniref:Helix-turn-helix domain-containing protein n=1 Tax=Citrobacter telavivensis TaxID=2653932 RepID=A0A6L5EAA1_9ENTR|nr:MULTISPECIES: helix-turn-helix transcriptional regulator [Enterobacteriaceae]MDU4362196.1 helix-turn-helix transcriptional regulator [Klebsiella oxytoca]HBU9778407.1 helix-turn-helix domain-containing protein [Klebsiella pneumoniae]EFK4094016.1 helix-turn-helix domain-containing protein [Escherichia coli]EFL6477725.1 helix-turn-helix domain-containing protein [Escherichia coli]EFN8014249.1 XRE family transcriptional regulator [Escherichia coli]
MKTVRNMQRTRKELSEFLRSRRERLEPADVGLTSTGRRRTPGLRREEVAALAGVGLTWYTWLEQGRDISVSAAFLDNLSRVLKLDATERRHLYLLTQQRPPVEPGKTWCIVPPLIHRLMGNLKTSPAYVINLRWDVIAWNKAADRVFHFSQYAPERRNLLWMIFADQATRMLFEPWEEQAHQLISHFRRDFVRATQAPDICELIRDLENIDPDFKMWWHEQDIHGPYYGKRQLNVEEIGVVSFEHTMLTIDQDRHLRLVYYAITEGSDAGLKFEEWICSDPN